MIYSIILMQGVSVQARAEITDGEDETPNQIADRARSEFMVDALGMRESRTNQIMTENTLNQFADLFRQIVLDQATSGEPRYVTAYTHSGEEVFHSEGQIALLGHNTDITCLIDVRLNPRFKR